MGNHSFSDLKMILGHRVPGRQSLALAEYTQVPVRGLDCPLSNRHTLAGLVRWNTGAAAWLPREVPSASPSPTYSFIFNSDCCQDYWKTVKTQKPPLCGRWTDHGGGVGTDNGVLVRLKAEGHPSVGRDAHESGGN